MKEQRRHERYPITVEVQVSHPELGVFLLNTRDMSDGGVFLQYGGNPRRPFVGTEVSLKLSELPGGDIPPTVHGRVVRVNDDGFAVVFS